jgi:hypothetical protein
VAAAETFFHIILNHSRRVAQIGGGKIEIKFRKREEDFVVYMQSDGEFYKVLNPVSVEIVLCDWLAGGCINMLRRSAH